MNRSGADLLRCVVLCGAVAHLTACVSTRYPQVSDEGLVRVEVSGLDAVYQKPGQDFRRFERFAVEPCEVSFRANWVRDRNRERDPGRHLSKDEVDESTRVWANVRPRAATPW